MKWLESLKTKLRALKLSEAVIASIVAAYETAAKNLGEDDKAHETLVGQLEAAGKQLAEAAPAPGTPINITVGAPAPSDKETPKALSEDDVRRVLAEADQKRSDDAKKLGEDKAARVKTFTDAIDAAKGLSEGARTELKKAGDLITAQMSDD